MMSFLKTFLASLLALIVFCLILFAFFIGLVSSLATKEKQQTGSQAVLWIDLSRPFPEIAVENPLASLGRKDTYDQPSLTLAIRLIEQAASDSAVKGIALECGSNGNGLASSEALRQALLDFKKSGKFVWAYGTAISQGGYYVATAADQIYCHPQGGVDWRGYVMQYMFLKGALDKLEIEPQVFFAGKFKSATEPFRTTRMTDANRLQSGVILQDFYGQFLELVSKSRGIDTATLHRYANEQLIRSASNALKYHLVDGLKYDDEWLSAIRKKMGLSEKADINFVPLGKYAQSASLPVNYRASKIAVIYAEGDIVSGKGGRGLIGSQTYVELIRKARLDPSIKAIVFRINSGGGSSLASEEMWRELSLARQEKPVVASFGDVAASGAYYTSCAADSIFAEPNSITGSIGVFSIVPNMQDFFNHKLGITFDAVKTAPDADMMSVVKPLTESQRNLLQAGVDSIYEVFKSRVAAGRKLDMGYVDSIGQGRVWSGSRAVSLGLADRIGGIRVAIACAASMAGLKDYRLVEYPEPENIFSLLLGSYQQQTRQKLIREELGSQGWQSYRALNRVRAMLGTPQARLPFDLQVE